MRVTLLLLSTTIVASLAEHSGEEMDWKGSVVCEECDHGHFIPDCSVEHIAREDGDVYKTLPCRENGLVRKRDYTAPPEYKGETSEVRVEYAEQGAESRGYGFTHHHSYVSEYDVFCEENKDDPTCTGKYESSQQSEEEKEKGNMCIPGHSGLACWNDEDIRREYAHISKCVAAHFTGDTPVNCTKILQGMQRPSDEIQCFLKKKSLSIQMEAAHLLKYALEVVEEKERSLRDEIGSEIFEAPLSEIQARVYEVVAIALNDARAEMRYWMG